jgi:type IV pilus assembly protein PilN
MIKINLLPYQKSVKVKRQQTLEVQLMGGGVALVLVALFLGFVWWSLNVNIEEQRDKKTSMTAQLEVLKKKVKEVRDVEQKKKLVEEKIAIIDQLKKNQHGPVRILDELSRYLPDRVWLISLTQQGELFDLNGRATTNFEIVDYIKNLKLSPYISGVELVESREGSEGGLSIYDFKLKFKFKV